MKIEKYLLENEVSIELTTVTVLINGEQKDAIPAFTKE